MAAKNSVEARQAVKGGAIAGAVGGAVLTVFMVLMNVMKGWDPWVPMKTAAYPWLGELVLDTGFEPISVLLGLGTHFAVSIGWGILFGVVFYGLSKGATVGVSLVWGIVVWLAMFYVVLPIVGAGELARHSNKAFAVIEHLLFGLGTGLAFLPFQRTRTSLVSRPHDTHVPAT